MPRGAPLWGMLALWAIAGGLYWHTPYSADNGFNNWQITPWLGGQMRFGLPCLGLLAVLAAAGAAALNVRRELTALLAALACALVPAQLGLLDKAAILLVLGGAALSLAPRGWLNRGPRTAKIAGLLALALACCE